MLRDGINPHPQPLSLDEGEGRRAPFVPSPAPPERVARERRVRAAQAIAFT